MHRAVALAAALILAAGCRPAEPPPTQKNDKTEVHVRTPGASVDVERKDGKAEVDAQRKDR